MLELLRKYRNPIILGLLLLSSLIFYSAYLRHKNTPSPLERKILNILSPLQESSDLATRGIATIWRQLFGASAAESERLRNENLALQAKLTTLAEITKENERLRKLLEFATPLGQHTVAARVIAADASSWFSTVMIDRGSKDGLKEGMAVITDQGVAGRIVTCASNSSRVLLIVDASSRVSTLSERTRSRGVSRGDGENLSFDYVPLTDDVKEGDIIVTSGLGDAFPKGLVVGRVIAVARRGFDMFQTIRIEPAVDLSRIEEVLVVIPDSPPVTGSQP